MRRGCCIGFVENGVRSLEGAEGLLERMALPRGAGGWGLDGEAGAIGGEQEQGAR